MNPQQIAELVNRQIKQQVSSVQDKTFYRGVVTAASGNHCNVELEGASGSIPNVLCVGSYIPRVDDVVIVLSIGKTGANFLVLGTLSGVGASDVSYIPKETPIGDVDGVNGTFTTNQPYVGGSLQVYVNGLAQSLMINETNPAAGEFTIDPPDSDSDISVSYQFSPISSGNADTLDGYHASSSYGSSTIPVLNSNGKLPESIIEKAYTLSESETGMRWVDGKPIYQKTIDLGNLPNTGVKQVNHGITYDTVVRLEGVCQSSSVALPLPFVGDGNSSPFGQIALVLRTTTVDVKTFSNRSSATGYVTIWYTKTTD